VIPWMPSMTGSSERRRSERRPMVGPLEGTQSLHAARHYRVT
jgi:hypothetical protein